jgi:predicted phosphodiesterase
MSKQKFSKADLARDYRSRFKKTPSLALARKMYNDNPEVFRNVEDARNRLLYIEGKSGHIVKKVKESEFFKTEARPLNPYKLPAAEDIDFKPYVITGKRFKRILVINDIHLPYHHIEAITLVIAWARKEKVEAVIINGDLLDFYALSRWEKDPRARNFSYELEQGRQFLAVLQKTLNVPVFYKLGNHEERYEKYLLTKAPELLGVEDFELHNLLKVKDYNTTIVKDKRIIRLNHLNVLHGHEFTGGFIAPVNIARGLFLRAKVAALQGHNHQSSDHTEKDLNDKIVTTWSVGCLCQLKPAYCPINKWNLGAAIVDLDTNGIEFEVRNKRIFNGKIY